MKPMLNTAIDAARSAGDIIIRHLDRLDQLKIGTKKHNDFVSEVDHLTEQEIIYAINKRYPDHAILAEESGVKNTADNPDTPQWIIDPLDGTTNFLHGFPQFAVSIAMKVKGVLQLGVIYDPMRQELFTGLKGEGARLDNRRIRMNADTHLPGSLIGTGFPYHQFDYVDRYMDILKQIMLKTAGIRRPGSAALDLAYVAANRLDGFWEFNLKAWDIAAGALLIQEAGGIVTDFAGENAYLETGDIVCGAPRVHKALLEIITSTDKS